MRRYRALLFWIPLSVAAIAQTMTPGVSRSSTGSPPKALRPISPAAELALDAAKRWTQEALDDSSNLPPINQELLLARIAKAWNAADHAKAQEYLKDAIEHLETKTSKSETESEALSEISSDVMVVDRSMWDRLIKLLHPSDASGAIAAEAQTLVEHDDPEGALKLEKKSLELGGSWADLETLSSLIGKNQTLATELFDEILNSASTHDGNADLISEILHRLNAQDDAFSRLLDKERRQRLADLVAQRILGGKREEACEYSLELEPLRSQ